MEIKTLRILLGLKGCVGSNKVILLVLVFCVLFQPVFVLLDVRVNY